MVERLGMRGGRNGSNPDEMDVGLGVKIYLKINKRNVEMLFIASRCCCFDC